MRIVILEDNIDRQRVMLESLADRFPGYAVEFFAAAPPMIEQLTQSGLYDVALLSLDHDLEFPEAASQRPQVDPGDGVDLATWLSTRPAVAPVIVHTTNNRGGDRMVELLASGGWRHERVVPYGGESWITESWLPLARNLVVSNLPGVSLSSFGTQIISCCLRANQSFAEHAIQELQRALLSLLSDLPRAETLSVELLYRGPGNQWRSIGDPSVIGQLLSIGAVIEEIIDIASIGPVLLDESPMSQELKRSLEEFGVCVLQVEIAQPLPNMQAVLCLTTGDANFQFDRHRVQTTISEMKSLIELVLLIEISKQPRSTRSRQYTSDIDPFPLNG